MKYFSFDPEGIFETFSTEEEARRAAQQSIDYYREDADDGWDYGLASQVCWGEIKQETVFFGTGKKVWLDGEMVDTVDCRLIDVES